MFRKYRQPLRIHASSSLREPLRDPHDFRDTFLNAPPPTPAATQRANQAADPDTRVDVIAVSKLVMEREHAKVSRQLDEALGQRDRARTVLVARIPWVPP